MLTLIFALNKHKKSMIIACLIYVYPMFFSKKLIIISVFLVSKTLTKLAIILLFFLDLPPIVILLVMLKLRSIERNYQIGGSGCHTSIVGLLEQNELDS